LEAELGNGWADGVHPMTGGAAGIPTQQPSIDMSLLRWSTAFAVMTENTVGSLTSVYPDFNPDGSFAGYIGSCLDVTEHKLAEEALSSVSRRLIEAHEEETHLACARAFTTISTRRLAFLTVTLDVVRRGLPADAAEASRSIGEVREQIKDLGKRHSGSFASFAFFKTGLLGPRRCREGFLAGSSPSAREEG